MFIDPGFIAVGCGAIIFVMGIWWGHTRGVSKGVEGTLDMLVNEGYIRLIEHNGDVEIMAIPEKTKNTS